MSETRKIEFDLEAIALLAVCTFLWLSLLSYDPADPIGPLIAPLNRIYEPDVPVYPPNAQCANWCGWVGAIASQMLIQGLGFGSILVLAGLTALAVWMFRVQQNTISVARQLGWLLVVIGFTTVASLMRFNAPFSAPIGSGGYLGALFSIWLNEHFALGGSLILTLTVLASGLLLSTDYLLVRWATWMLLGGATFAGAAASMSRRTVPVGTSVIPVRKQPRLSDVETGVQVSDAVPASVQNSTDAMPIRFRGQKIDPNAIPGTSAAASPIESVVATIAAAGNSLLATAKPKSDETPVAADEQLEGALEDPAESIDEPTEFRTVQVEGEDVQVRADNAHGLPGPRVRNKKKRPTEQPEGDSLAHLDDTSLPEGSEEYVLPGVDLLLESEDVNFEEQAQEVTRKAKILEKTFADFGLNVRVVEIETGPVIAQYEVELEAGLRLSKITGLADDLAIALRVPSVRIVAPIPGKNTVGIEVPNETRVIVRLREVIEEGVAASKKAKIPLFLGKDVSGNPLTVDLASLPHLLIAGRTGTGKSVCLNAIIASILMTKRPDEVRMLMIDPKMVELSGYARLPHLMHPVVTDMRKAEAILAWAVDKMEERYALLARAGVRHIVSYNQLGREELLERLKPESPEESDAIPDHLPFIVIVADELADLMMTCGKEVEQHIIRLAQKSRAIGIHLILATQKPTVDVITGLIKSNLPARIAFQVASRTDSRVVLDEMGADKLLGNGDMLFLWPGTSTLLRGQGTYLSDDEINRVVDHCSTGEQNFVNELVNLKLKAEGDEEGEEGIKPNSLRKRDELYEAAIDIVVREGRGSVSLLQRSLGIGYGRAARLIDFMAEDGFVGQYNGSQAREVAISLADWEAVQAGMYPNDSGAKNKPPVMPTDTPKRNRIRRDESWDSPDANPTVTSGATALKLSSVHASEQVLPWEDSATDEETASEEFDQEEELEDLYDDEDDDEGQTELEENED